MEAMNLALEKLVAKHETKPSLIIDVGAYKGDYAALMYEKYGCDIICFEPVPEFWSECRKRFAGNTHIVVYNAAVGAEDTPKRPLYLNDVGSSFFITKEYRGEGSIDVPVVELSKIFLDLGRLPDILKMNCEGAEYEIIDDIADSIPGIPEILVQFHKVLLREDRKKARDIIKQTHRLVYSYKWDLYRKNDTD